MNKITTFFRRCLHLSLAKWDQLTGKPKPLVTIFCYHSIANDNWLFSTSKKAFELQLTALKKEYDFISLAEVERYLKGTFKIEKPSVVFTFDDGYQNLQQLKSTIKKFKLRPTVFALSQPDQVNRKELDNDLPITELKDLKKLTHTGWSVGSHTATHPNLKTATYAQLQTEIFDSRKKIESAIQRRCRWIAYPKGKYNPAVLKNAKKAGYHLGLSMDDSIITPASNRLALPRIGINHTHQIDELLALNSPSCIWFRNLIKNYVGFAL